MDIIELLTCPGVRISNGNAWLVLKDKYVVYLRKRGAKKNDVLYRGEDQQAAFKCLVE